ncbi:MAG: peptidase, partial [Steroidobacteraceae bacterium]|nr:peptidase [Steroidobacteraceae bacterium]
AASHAAPRRHPMAWVFAALTPRLGIAGGGGAMIVMIAIIAILAAIAIPAYQDFTLRAQVAQAMPMVDQVQDAAEQYVIENRSYPETPADVGLPEAIDDGPVSEIRVIDGGFELTLRSDNHLLDGKTIIVSAMEYEDGSIGWDCSGGTVEPKHRPAHCRPAP